MWTYKATISYKGTRYFGWQPQPEDHKETVQEAIHAALKKISKFEICKIAGASRTDAGVHAQGQVAKLSLPLPLSATDLLRGMNSLLPSDIRILACEPCPEAFNPVKDCLSKRYHYYFSTAPVENPLQSELVASFGSSLEIEKMKDAAEIFQGEHDFYNFCARDSKAASSVRQIESCKILQGGLSAFDDSLHFIEVEGSGFLKQMVRYMVQALVGVGRGEISNQDIINSLARKEDKKLSSKARAKGLHLMSARY